MERTITLEHKIILLVIILIIIPYFYHVKITYKFHYRIFEVGDGFA